VALAAIRLRPIFHWTAPRVRADVLLCMLAHHVEHHMRSKAPGVLSPAAKRSESPAETNFAPSSTDRSATAAA
jgi:hypothetical protein